MGVPVPPRPQPSFEVSDNFGNITSCDSPSRYHLPATPHALTPEEDELPADPFTKSKKRPIESEDNPKPAKRPAKDGAEKPKKTKSKAAAVKKEKGMKKEVDVEKDEE
ncbi:hypothetical protein MPER_05440, partial [Moniliophthora perniciosa FA553]